jgi:uncharacterized protein (DUF4415 family)
MVQSGDNFCHWLFAGRSCFLGGMKTRKGSKREYDFSGGKRGPILSIPKGKTRIMIRLDDDILDWFRRQVDEAGGGNYQTLINEALKQHIRRA